MNTTDALVLYGVLPVLGASFALHGALWLYMNKLSATGERRVDLMQKEGYEFRLYCSQQYASVVYTKDIEQRMVTSLARIEGKLDKLIDQQIDRARYGHSP